MGKGFEHQIVLLVPQAGPPVVAGNLLCSGLSLVLVQALPQQIGEEPVVAIPAPLVVERDDEEVGLVERLQRGLPGRRGVARDGVAEGAAQAIQDRRLQQKFLNAGGLLLQNFFHQIVHDKAMAAGKRMDKLRNVVGSRVLTPLHRNSRQLQARNPALRALLQRSDFVGGQAQPHGVVEKASRFGGGKAQVGGAQLG